ncbi:uncharacterized protein LOC144859368 [Branchiostoma floridae x Branchiostoma japonicum]
MARTSSMQQQKRSKQENGRKSRKLLSKVAVTGGGGRMLASRRRGSVKKVDNNQHKARQSGRSTSQDLRLRGRTVPLANSSRAGSSRRPSASAGSRHGAAKATAGKSKSKKRSRSASGSAKASSDSSRSAPGYDRELVPRRWDDDGRPIYTRRGRQIVIDMKTRMRNQAPELEERELRGGRIVITEKRHKK